MKSAAKRMGATTVEMKSSHVPMLSHPKTSTRRDPDRRSGRAETRGYNRGVVRSHSAPPTAPGAAFGGSRDAVPCKGWPARGVGDERTGFRTRRLLQRNWGRAGEISVASFLRWGALPRDARFSALVPHARWRNPLASNKRQQLRPLGRRLHRALHSETLWRVE